MKKMTKFAALLMALVLAMGSMTACGGNGDKETNSAAPANSAAPEASAAAADDGSGEKTPVTLKVWAPQEEQKGDFGDYGDNLLQYMADEFNKAQSKWELTIEPAVCAEGDLKTEIQKDPAAGADVFMYAGDQALELQDNGILQPLTSAGMEDVKSNNPVAAIESVTLEDKDLGESFVYGVPFTPNQWFMYYDKSKFNEDEVKSLDTIMSKDLGDGVYNFSTKLMDSWYVASFFFAAGCELFPNGDETVCTFNNDAGVAAANYMIDLAANKKFLNEDGKGIGISYLKEGKLGAWCGGSWDAASVKEALGDNYAAAALPTVKIGDTEDNLKPFADYKYIGVNSNSANAEAAEDFAVYLGGEACQKVRYEARGVIPTWTSLAGDDAIKADPIVVALDNQKEKLAARGQTKQMNNYWTPAEAFGQGVYNKEITKDNAKAKLDDMVKNMLAQIN